MLTVTYVCSTKLVKGETALGNVDTVYFCLTIDTHSFFKGKKMHKKSAKKLIWVVLPKCKLPCIVWVYVALNAVKWLARQDDGLFNI